MTQNEFLGLVCSQDFEGLERAWQSALAEPGETGLYRDTVRALCENNSHTIALGFDSDFLRRLAKQNNGEYVVAGVRGRKSNFRTVTQIPGTTECEPAPTRP